MDNETALPWGQPWNFLFKKGTDQQGRKAAMADIGKKLYDYIEKSLGSKKHFTLQISWSQSVDNSQLFKMYANLIVMQEAVVAWQKRNKYDYKAKKDDYTLDNGFQLGFGFTFMAGTKPPPPPPPPPPRGIELFSNDAPFEYFSNLFKLSHVLEFSKTGDMTQFNEGIPEPALK